MQLFFSDHIKAGIIQLKEEEARHCAQVLRKQTGDVIQVVDGRGNWYEAELLDCSKKACQAKILSEKAVDQKRDYRIHIGIAPTKNISRLEWFLGKATEIGIDEITPLLCQRSERKIIRNDRLEKILLAAMKQSLKATLPNLYSLTRFEDFVRSLDAFKGQKYIAYCEESVNITLRKNYRAGQDVCILIGPEGDFTAEEVKLAQSAGFEALSLGASRLRTETAGVIACHTIHLLNEK